jgi:pilus assembly protein CpaB
MDRKKMVLAATVGLFTGTCAFLILHHKASELEARTTPIEVWVAARYIPPGSRLIEGMAEKRIIPKAFVAPSAINRIEEVEELRALVPFSAGEQLLSNKFGAGYPTLSASLGPGRRAFTVGVDEMSGVGGLLRPGDHVDLMAKISLNGREATSTVLQNIEVLATGRTLGRAPDPLQDGETSAPEDGYGTLTLSVSPEEAEILFHLEGRPKAFALRSPGDEKTVLLSTMTESMIWDRLGRTAKRDKDRTIEVIRSPSEKGEQQ